MVTENMTDGQLVASIQLDRDGGPRGDLVVRQHEWSGGQRWECVCHADGESWQVLDGYATQADVLQAIADSYRLPHWQLRWNADPDDDTWQWMQQRARERVHADDRLMHHADFILSDWSNQHEHVAWLLTATVEEIVRWYESGGQHSGQWKAMTLETMQRWYPDRDDLPTAPGWYCLAWREHCRQLLFGDAVVHGPMTATEALHYRDGIEVVD